MVSRLAIAARMRVTAASMPRIRNGSCKQSSDGFRKLRGSPPFTRLASNVASNSETPNSRRRDSTASRGGVSRVQAGLVERIIAAPAAGLFIVFLVVDFWKMVAEVVD